MRERSVCGGREVCEKRLPGRFRLAASAPYSLFTFRSLPAYYLLLCFFALSPSFSSFHSPSISFKSVNPLLTLESLSIAVSHTLRKSFEREVEEGERGEGEERKEVRQEVSSDFGGKGIVCLMEGRDVSRIGYRMGIVWVSYGYRMSIVSGTTV